MADSPNPATDPSSPSVPTPATPAATSAALHPAACDTGVSGTPSAASAASAASAPPTASQTLRINEVFYSIQGESTWAGCRCVFVRLTGCHLRCTYCDTEYAFKEGTSRSIDELLEEACGFGCDLVEITGGEPLLQPRVHDLIRRLADRGKTVLIETSGACDIAPLDPRSIAILDVKCPGSGEAGRNLWSNLDRLRPRDEVKFVIADRGDYEYARDVIARHDLARRCAAVLLSPVHAQPRGLEIAGAAGLPLKQLAEWMLADRLPARMQTQLHKSIWAANQRGV